MKQSPDHLCWAVLSAAVTANAKCAYCGAAYDLVAHHKMPRRYGGLDRLSNLEAVCRSCHPQVEQDAIARAKQSWERPEWPQPPQPRRCRRRLIRPC